MKLALATIAVIAFANAAAFAKSVDGCEVLDMGGYLNKVDPTCTFDHQPGGGASPSTYGNDH